MTTTIKIDLHLEIEADLNAKEMCELVDITKHKVVENIVDVCISAGKSVTIRLLKESKAYRIE